jgi:hypothetical protein
MLVLTSSLSNKDFKSVEVFAAKWSSCSFMLFQQVFETSLASVMAFYKFILYIFAQSE